MTEEQIKIMSEIEKLDHDGFIIEAHRSFIGYDCQIVIMQNDHDDYIHINNEKNEFKSFNSRWDAYKAGLEWIKKNKKNVILY